jgi:hypothetical protein
VTLTPCPICHTPFEAKKIGAHVRRFCSVPCKRKHEQLVRTVGEAAVTAIGVSRATGNADEKGPA